MMSKREIDKYFSRNGSCMFHRTRYARHRLIDAIKGRHQAGESIRSLVDDYGLSRAAILAAINSTPDDNRMTRKEMQESHKAWTEFAKGR